MKDQNKTETELINELVKLRKRIAELEAEVNQRKCVEETLREYQKVIESSEDMIAVVDHHYKYLLANARFVQYRGLDREQVVGRPVPEVLGEDVFEKVVKKNLDACFQGEVVQYEMKYTYPELGERDLLVSYFPIENPDGVDRATSVIRDITERKRVEEEYRTILRTTMDGFWITDIQGRFLDVNDAYCRLIGYSRDELLNMRISDVESAERPEETAARIQRIMETGGDRFETRHRCKDGRIIDIEVSVNHTEVGGGQLFVFLRDITERKRAEEALRQSEEKYRNILESIQDGYFEADLAGNCTFANDARCRSLGYTKEELIGMNNRQYSDPESAKRVYQGFNRAYKTGEPVKSLEEEVIRKDGTKALIELSVSLVRGSEGKPIGFRGISRDITERKRREGEIQRKTVLLEAINNIFKVALTCETSAEVAGRCLTLAQKLTSSQFGFIGEVNEAGYFDTIALSDPGWEKCKMPKADAVVMINNMEIRGIWGQVIKGRKSLIVNQPSSHPDRVGIPAGHPPITAFLGVPLEHSGRTFGMIGLANKKSEYSSVDQEVVESLSGAFVEVLIRKRVEEALRQSEEKYRTILENIEESYYEVDLRGNLTFFNDSASQILGYPKEELMGMNDRQYTDQENARKLFQAFNEVYRTGKRSRVFGYEIIRKDGAKRHVEASISLRKDASGRPIGFGGIIRDITERKRMEEQLLQAEKLRAVGEMASGVAHDFNNALAAILGNTQLLLYTAPEGELKETLKIVEQVAKDSSRTVRRLQDFTRRPVPQELSKMDINSVVKDSIEITRPKWKDEAQSRGVVIEIVSNLEDIPLASGSASELREVITNMIFNAVEALPEGGRIDIRTFRKRKGIHIQISDTGVGIPEEAEKKIFEPFFTTKPFTNTGLGLSMSYGIVKRFGGEIDVESKVGRGTTFTITLPVGEEGKEEAVDPRPIKKGRKAHILVIDDEEFVRSVLSRTLAQADHRVTLAEDGRKGVQLFKEGKFDIVLTDLGMPGVSGWEVCRLIKEVSPHTPVGMITGWGEEKSRDKMEEYGLDFFISKPFDLAQILNVVAEAIESRKN